MRQQHKVMAETDKQISYTSELARKGIHLASMGIPLVYLNVPYSLSMALLFGLTALSVTIDVVKHYHQPTRKLFFRTFGSLLRSHETQQERLLLTGASWVLIAAFLTLLLFPPVVAVTAFTILILSDTFAALVGRRVRSTKFLDKSVAGTLTFIVVSWMVVAFYGVTYALPYTYWLAGMVGGVVGGLAEAASIRLKLDDNLSVPFSVAACMIFLNEIFKVAHLPMFTDLLQ